MKPVSAPFRISYLLVFTTTWLDFICSGNVDREKTSVLWMVLRPFRASVDSAKHIENSWLRTSRSPPSPLASGNGSLWPGSFFASLTYLSSTVGTRILQYSHAPHTYSLWCYMNNPTVPPSLCPPRTQTVNAALLRRNNLSSHNNFPPLLSLVRVHHACFPSEPLPGLDSANSFRLALSSRIWFPGDCLC